MPKTCTHSRTWLFRTVTYWTQESCRLVSTTSAINHGLRASEKAERGRQRGRSEIRSGKESNAPRNSLRDQVSFKKFTSGGERPNQSRAAGSAWSSNLLDTTDSLQVTKLGGRNRSVKEANDRISQVALRRDRRLSKVHLRRAPRESTLNKNIGAQWQRSRAPSLPKPELEYETSNESLRQKYSPKAHPELHQSLYQLEQALVILKQHKTAGLKSQSQPWIVEPSRKAGALVEKITEKMQTGEWPKRYVRNALNDRGSKMHFWSNDPRNKREGRVVEFDYENATLKLVNDGEASVEAGSVSNPRTNTSDRTEIMFKLPRSRLSDTNPETTSTKLRGPPMKRGSKGDNDEEMPIAMPYTTAASVFLYGTNTILASLKARRRKIYKLYISPQRSSLNADPDTRRILEVAKTSGVSIHRNTPTRLLDKMSSQRPHNGMVIETSRLPAPPVLALGTPDATSNSITIKLAPQSAEDLAINGPNTDIPLARPVGRKPFILMLDGILDPGNLGSILRSAYFYSVDVVAVSTNTCAKLDSAVLAKASSGACEAIPILNLPKPSAFVYESAKIGWKVFAAVAPDDKPSPKQTRHKVKRLDTLSAAQHNPLSRDPCILMLGAEGEGLRDTLKQRADFFVTINGGRTGKDDVGVDSLNVSAASSVLLEAFLRQKL